MAKIRTARIDPDTKMFLGMVEIDEQTLQEGVHLAHLGECDNTPGAYRWEAAEDQPAGGQLVPIGKARRAVDATVTLEQAAAFDYLSRWADGAVLHDAVVAWLDAIIFSYDFRAVRRDPLVVAYAAKRGLSFGGE